PPVRKELGRLTFEGVPDKLEYPSNGEQPERDGPQTVEENCGDGNEKRHEDERDADRMTEAVDWILMACRVLRDPLVPGTVTEHAALCGSIGRGMSHVKGSFPCASLCPLW